MNTLHSLHKGETGVVSRISARGGMRRRLQDIGLVEGTAVQCLQKGPFGDPTAYQFRGAVIALRAVDAQSVYIL